jgi:hypothetical protein
MMWKPSRKEIEEWISEKEDEFTRRETKNLQINLNDGNKGTYIHICMKFSLLSFLVYCMNG